MNSPLEDFYLSEKEPLQSALFAMRNFILNSHEDITEALRWGVPTFYMDGTFMAYLWKAVKGSELPYLGFNKGTQLDHPILDSEGRKLIKVIRFRPDDDLPVKPISEIIAQFRILIDTNK